MRNLLQRIGAPASFWENIPVPMEAQTLEQIPSQSYQSVVDQRFVKKYLLHVINVAIRAASGKECNKECNICMMSFETEDMVRVFPCCNLAQHTDCLVQWFNTHDTCIVCRKKISDLTGTAPAAVDPSSTESVSTERVERSDRAERADQAERNERESSSDDNFGNSFMSALMLSALMGSIGRSGRSTNQGNQSTSSGNQSGRSTAGNANQSNGGGTSGSSGCPCGRDHTRDLAEAVFDRYSNAARTELTDNEDDGTSTEEAEEAQEKMEVD